MQARRLTLAGVLGITAVSLYVGATVLGGILDPGYSHVRQAISELTGSRAPNRAPLAGIYIAYNIVLLGFAWGISAAAGGRRLFRVAVGLFAIAALSGIGQVTAFRMDSIGSPDTAAGTMHVVLASVSSLLTLAATVLYGVAFRRAPDLGSLSLPSFAAAGLLVLTAPAAALSIGTDLMGLFERLTIGAFMLWVVFVSVELSVAARALARRPVAAGSALEI